MSSRREVEFMRRALALAAENAASDGGPFGALVVRGGEILAEGTNRVTSLRDPTAHAEIVAIRRACEILGSHQLDGCEIYSSCEPCPMCLGAIYWARPERVYYAAARSDAAAAGFDDEYIYGELAEVPQQRRLETIRLLGDEGMVPLQIWLGNDGRQPY